VKVDVAHQIDSSEPNAEGLYDYFYEYDDFTFSDGPISYLARSYADRPQEASFRARIEDGRHQALTRQDLQHPLLLEARSWLRDAGKTELNWLDRVSGGYSRLR
jgi:hypothetical protein